MQLQLAVLADAANVSVEGKLNILGQFDVIWADTVPVGWPEFCYVVRVRAGVADAGHHTFELRILTDDGDLMAVASAAGEFEPAEEAGDEVAKNIILTIRLATFPEFGTYQFELRVDGEVLGEPILLYVRQKPSPADDGS